MDGANENISSGENPGLVHSSQENNQTPSRGRRKRRLFNAHDILQRPNKRHQPTESEDSQFNQANPPQAATSIDTGTRDWHMELLTGLFLRSSEQEIEWLEQEVEAGSNTHDQSIIETSDIKPAADCADSKFECVDSKLYNETADQTVFPLIPAVLRRVCAPTEVKPDEDPFNRPLLIPQSWKRPTYESLTLKELQQKVKDSVQCNGSIDNMQNGSLYSKHAETDATPVTHCTECKEHSKSLNMTPILYNECSVSALSNWAMMDGPDPTADIMTTEEWGAYEKNVADRLSLDCKSYETPVAGFTFRKCSVCNMFGHYEVECELLLDQNDGKKGVGASVNAQDTKRPQRSLDERTRRCIVSDLSKELRVQRLLQDVMHDARQENSAESSQQLESAEIFCGGEHDIVEDSKYDGKSTTCTVCKSGLAGHQMLMCDICDDLFHLKCLDPPLETIPKGEWLCPPCMSYDSDESSVVVIEGCGDFVIEQRKRSLAEESKKYAGFSLGQHQCEWTGALSVVDEADPVVDDEYVQDHIDDGCDIPNLSPGKLCWAKSWIDDTPEWWPAMILEPSDSRRILTDVYSVRFFYLNKKKNVFSSGVLPYLPYFEDIGYRRLVISGWENGLFRNALISSVHALGFKTFGQVLKISRSGIQKTLHVNNASADEYQRLRITRWRLPVSWERADVDEVDNFVILSKEKQMVDASTIATNKSSNAPASLHSSQAVQNEVELDFFLDEVVGGIVSWKPEDQPLNDDCYGNVLSINPTTEMALLRSISILGILNDHLQPNDKSIHAHDIGSTFWMPLRQLRFVSSKPNFRSLQEFKSKLRARMKKEIKLHKSRSDAAAVALEENTVELQLIGALLAPNMADVDE